MRVRSPVGRQGGRSGKLWHRFHGVTVSTLDFESSSPSSTLGGACVPLVARALSQAPSGRCRRVSSGAGAASRASSSRPCPVVTPVWMSEEQHSCSKNQGLHFNLRWLRRQEPSTQHVHVSPSQDWRTPLLADGELAQVVERSLSMREAAGSMPAFSRGLAGGRDSPFGCGGGSESRCRPSSTCRMKSKQCTPSPPPRSASSTLVPNPKGASPLTLPWLV